MNWSSSPRPWRVTIRTCSSDRSESPAESSTSGFCTKVRHEWFSLWTPRMRKAKSIKSLERKAQRKNGMWMNWIFQASLMRSTVFLLRRISLDNRSFKPCPTNSNWTLNSPPLKNKACPRHGPIQLNFRKTWVESSIWPIRLSSRRNWQHWECKMDRCWWSN